MCACMGTKTISIMDDVHKLLVRNRISGESFSDVIRRTLSGKKNLLAFAGAWKSISEADVDEMKNDINKLRRSSTRELFRKHRE